ncbi:MULTISPECIES: uroporphyrinogen-III synthase [unclassified Polaromonas]|uniref:uroporphyrinogen-III synthase n=1 Tax=unclassified Polaromonas TaxID=2638319 RepID=UPI0025D33780|nr:MULTISPECIES: uroporphyrinogen-III synthase [unclassified Polaromonas]HQS01286.1 uroporphyrinogen-III synthase [Polaromonas sp.]HQS41056.1 uroporphyrinogen-III synthase [Polaromonas sp.]HQS86805.1 uroporphyrinogen-III synthase [Polaromonas sp.]HQT09138.1 uroporphyrinogen-III synthase [Polaromonas sp.]
MNAVRVIVTRPEREAAGWVQSLQAHGLQAEALPLIEIAALPESPALQQAWREIGTYSALMFVSGNAVDGFFASNQAAALVQKAQAATDSIASMASAGPRFLAPGPGTVAALRRAGVPEALIDAPAADAGQFDSEALWAVVNQRHWQGQRVLIVRGHGAGKDQAGGAGRDWLAQQFAAAGARVEVVAVYQRRAPVFTESQRQRIAAAAHDGSVWLLSSSEALAHLPAGDWSRARAVATHPRIAEAARAAGWGVVVQSRPEMADIVGSIESIPP